MRKYKDIIRTRDYNKYDVESAGGVKIVFTLTCQRSCSQISPYYHAMVGVKFNQFS